MSNYDRPHTYDKAPSPSAKRHRAAVDPDQTIADQPTNKTGRHSK